MDIVRRSWVLLSILFFTVSALGDSSSSSFEIQIKPQHFVLSNGLTIILVEDPKVPIVSYQTWFHVGSADEAPGLTGMTHLFEHLMFKGTPKYGPKQFFQILESQGATLNAFTTRDYSVFYEEFSPSLLEKVIDLESDRMSHLVIDDQALNNERMIVFEERRLKQESQPEAKVQDVLWQLAYRRHPYQWPIMGNPMDILSMTSAHLNDFYKKYFQPGNASLIIVGNFNSQKILQLLKKYYGPIPGKPKPKQVIAEEFPQTEERRFIIREAVSAERFAQGFHISSALQDDSYALDVLANILFEGSSARVRHQLVEKLGLVSTISGSAYTPAHPGMFIISGTMKPGVAYAKAEGPLWQSITAIQEQGVRPEEVQTAIKQLSVQVLDGIRTPHGLGQLLGTVQTIFKDPSRFFQDLEKYRQITPADVQRVAKKYLDPNNRTVITVMPPK